MKRLVQGLAIALICVAAHAQDRFAGVEIEATHAAGNVWVLEGAGGNIGVSVGPDGILIVDDQFAPLADKIRAALKELGEGKLKFVLNTHWHGDHVGGNEVFGPEAPIIAHHNVRKRMSAKWQWRGQTTEPKPKEALPVVTFGDSLTVHFNDEEIRVLHLPNGHTDGDSVIFFTGSNVVHLGDDFFAGRFPFVDIESGGSVDGLIAAIARVIDEVSDDVKIIPGHGGPVVGVNELKAYHGMLVATSGIVKKRIAEGKSLKQLVEEGLPEEWSGWAGNFISEERWIGILHESYSE